MEFSFRPLRGGSSEKGKSQTEEKRTEKHLVKIESAAHRLTLLKNTAGASMGIKGGKLMERPPPSPDLNPIENLWSILKKKKKPMRAAESWTSELQLWGGLF